MSELPKRDARALIRDLRARAAILTGQSWERSANRDMMNEAAQMIEDLLQAAAPPAPTAEPRLTTLGDAIRELRELVRTEAGHIAYFDDHLDAVVAAALRKGSATPERVSEGKRPVLRDPDGIVEPREEPPHD